jgi:hypothetical protein
MASQIEMFYQNECKTLQTQNTLLIQENNALKNKCTQLEIELKYKSDSLLKFQNCDFNKLLQQKEMIIELMQNELCFYKNNNNNNNNGSNSNPSFRMINTLSNSCNNVSEVSKLKLKVEELSKENTSLVEIVNKLTQELASSKSQYNQLCISYDKKLNDILRDFPKKIAAFNMQKESAAKFLVDQMNVYIEEKKTFIGRLTELENENKQLLIENEKLRNKLNNVETVYHNHIEEMNSHIDYISNKNNSIPHNDMTMCLMQIQNKVHEKNIEIQNLQNKLSKYKTVAQHEQNIFSETLSKEFDNKDIVNTMSKELYDRDIQIHNLKQKLFEQNK